MFLKKIDIIWFYHFIDKKVNCFTMQSRYILCRKCVSIKYSVFYYSTTHNTIF